MERRHRDQLPGYRYRPLNSRCNECLFSCQVGILEIVLPLSTLPGNLGCKFESYASVQYTCVRPAKFKIGLFGDDDCGRHRRSWWIGIFVVRCHYS